jgi:hypothetical protein
VSVEYAVFSGLDVGEGEHHACALDSSGEKLHDKPLPNDEQRLRALFTQLGRHGSVLVVVDQPASIGALPVAVARATGCQVAYLPGLTMRRLADLHPGNAKTDAPALSRTRCAASTPVRRLWPSWRSSSGPTTTWRASRPGWSTGSAACWSPSTPRWKRPWDHGCTTRPHWSC